MLFCDECANRIPRRLKPNFRETTDGFGIQIQSKGRRGFQTARETFGLRTTRKSGGDIVGTTSTGNNRVVAGQDTVHEMIFAISKNLTTVPAQKSETESTSPCCYPAKRRRIGMSLRFGRDGESPFDGTEDLPSRYHKKCSQNRCSECKAQINFLKGL